MGDHDTRERERVRWARSRTVPYSCDRWKKRESNWKGQVKEIVAKERKGIRLSAVISDAGKKNQTEA